MASGDGREATNHRISANMGNPVRYLNVPRCVSSNHVNVDCRTVKSLQELLPRNINLALGTALMT